MCREYDRDFLIGWIGFIVLSFILVGGIVLYQTMVGMEREKTAQELIKAGTSVGDIACIRADTYQEILLSCPGGQLHE